MNGKVFVIKGRTTLEKKINAFQKILIRRRQHLEPITISILGQTEKIKRVVLQ